MGNSLKLENEMKNLLILINSEISTIDEEINGIQDTVTRDLDSLLTEYRKTLELRHGKNFKPEEFIQNHFETLKNKKAMSLKRAKKKLIGLRNEICIRTGIDLKTCGTIGNKLDHPDQTVNSVY